MKIEKRGIRISELPGAWVIETQEDGTVEFGSSAYSMEEIRQLRDAFNVVLGEQEDKGITPAPEFIVDKDGDEWVRQDDGLYVHGALRQSRNWIEVTYGIREER